MTHNWNIQSVIYSAIIGKQYFNPVYCKKKNKLMMFITIYLSPCIKMECYKY